jgi:hypothetical protein
MDRCGIARSRGKCRLREGGAAPFVKNLANIIGIAIGISIIYCGFKNRSGYNDADAPLTQKQLEQPNRPVTRLDRTILIAIGSAMIMLGLMGEFTL